MGRFVPITYVTTYVEKYTPAVTGAKTYYDGKQCWQYKVVYDRPGSYTFTVPANAICARTVLVGGGGKPKCLSLNADSNTSGCNSAAGAGGAYSEKYHAVTGGTTSFSIVVGRQEQDTTLACNSVAVHTAGGAAGCIAGAASGGDWNSNGGGVGYTCNNCGGSYSHYCGSQKCIALTNCCGYCIVYQYDPAGSTGICCTPVFAGGGSSGSFLAQCGGYAWGICGMSGNGSSSIASGGAGIGSWGQSGLVWHYNCCDCICFYKCDGRVGFHDFCACCPSSAQGGGGTQAMWQSQCRSTTGTTCAGGVWKGGDGGMGGADKQEGTAWTFEWGYHAVCSYPFGSVWCQATCKERCAYSAPVRHQWWDIHDMCGTGSPGTLGNRQNCIAGWGWFFGTRPRNAGEGAGTGGIVSLCCSASMTGNMIGATNGSGP